MKRSFYVFSIVICSLIIVTIGTSWAVTGTSGYDISGTWNYYGTGTINGHSAEDVGNATIKATGDIGSQTISGFAVFGTITNMDSNLKNSYSYSVDDYFILFTGNFKTTIGGLTITFTEISDDTATMTQKGTISDEDGNNYYINLTYQATRGTSSGGGSGGGCDIGFDPVSLLLFLPLFFVMKKQ